LLQQLFQLEPLNVDGENGYEERMDKKPMRDKHDNCKSTELARRPACKKGDYPENDVVRKYLKRVGSAGSWEALGDAFFDGKGDRGLNNSFDLGDRDQ
jgi:hypothetical protein